MIVKKMSITFKTFNFASFEFPNNLGYTNNYETLFETYGMLCFFCSSGGGAAAQRWRQQQALLASSCSCGLSCCVHSAGLRRPLQTLTRRSRCCWRRAAPRRATRRRRGGGGRGTTNGRTDERTQHSTTHAIHVPLRWQQGDTS